jgi:RNA polymerase sigma-70 factor, ECF subfamily
MTDTDIVANDLNLEKLRGGDRDEFARLVLATSAQIYRLGMKMLNDPQDAEDVLQETYLKALKALPAFEGRASLTTWLYRIAVNEALMLIRRRKPEAAIEEEPDAEEDGELSAPVQIADFSHMPEQEFLSAESRRFLNSAIQELSPGLRAVFVLRDVQGLSIKETAEALNLTETNVKIRLLRARLKLREGLTAYYGVRLTGASANDRGTPL